DHARLFNLAVGTGPAARSKNRRQTGDARSVSSPIATVDVIRAHHRASELLRDVVQLVCCLGATEHPEVARIIFRDRCPQPLYHAVQRFFPGRRAVSAILADQRLSQTALCRYSHSWFKT